LYHASIKPARGLHIRFLLGDRRGLAILGATAGPLAWQVLSWDSDGTRLEAMAQARSLLEIHAVRRLGLESVKHVSVQGTVPSEETLKTLGGVFGLTISVVDGPPYDADFVSLGLALGALSPNAQTLNLAASLQAQTSLLSRAPWADIVVLVVLLGGMYGVMDYYRSDLAQQLAVSTQRNNSVAWAVKLTDGALKKELSTLKNEVAPLQKFVTGRMSFSATLSAIAAELPATTWLMSVTGEALVWEKNPNKALGEQYLMLQIGAPAERRGEVPPEINDTVRALVNDRYLAKTLPRIKLADVVWQEQGREGHSVFSILALPAD
jgi:hypothetical protein